MLDNWQIGMQLEFLIDIIIALAAGFVIGAERESRGKPAGIGTNSLVIGGSMLFTYLSAAVHPEFNFAYSSAGSKRNRIFRRWNDP